jgi:hypothetical protein
MSSKEPRLSTEIPDYAIPSDPQTLLTRRATAAVLTSAGFPVTAATLATWASRGGGPRYKLFGRRPLYAWADCLDWARGRLSPPAANSSEASISVAPKSR